MHDGGVSSTRMDTRFLLIASSGLVTCSLASEAQSLLSLQNQHDLDLKPLQNLNSQSGGESCDKRDNLW